MSRDFCVALPHCAMGMSGVCDCGISRSYSLTIQMFSDNSLEIQSLTWFLYEKSDLKMSSDATFGGL